LIIEIMIGEKIHGPGMPLVYGVLRTPS